MATPASPAAGASSRRRELRNAIKILESRCLPQAATWAAEVLLGLPEDAPASTPQDQDGPHAGNFQEGSRSRQPGGAPGATSLGSSQSEADPRAAGNSCEGDTEDSAGVILGRLYLGGKEYRRAGHVLRNEAGPVAFFLRNYALLLAGEKRKEEEALEQGNLQPAKAQRPTNAELPRLQQVLGAAEQAGQLDAFGLFLFGLVLVKREQRELAIDMLCRSVSLFPCNWSAWMELQTLCVDSATYESVLPRLNKHWVRFFWEASALVDLHKNSEGLDRCASLAQCFPRSLHLVAHAATAKYNLRDFDAAEPLFEELVRADPFRVEGLDTFSNILYVKEKFAALSNLAHQLVLVDKYRPETCCVIGNYFSLKGRHERAVVYFRRALKLNPSYLSAWTLMGHEFVEMKNTPAAIEAYRHAVDISPKDYRAWYGLGQTYEILALPYYALYYYRKATQLRPQDARMWCALGQCYESEQAQGALGAPAGAAGAGGGAPPQLGVHKAIRCYERAYQFNDADGIALMKLAKLNQALGRVQTAAFYHKKNLERLDLEQAGGAEVVEALLFLANFHRGTGELELAEQYCSRLLDHSGPGKEQAKGLLKEIRSVHQHQQQQQQQQAGARPSALSTPQGAGRGLRGEDLPAADEDEDEDEDELEGFEEEEAMDLGETP